MKRTSSWTTSNSETSLVPRSRKKSTSRWTSSSGALAPDEMPDDALALEPLLLHLRLVVDQVRVGAVVAGDLDEPVRVRGVARADHEHEVALARHLADGHLAVGRGVTDVVGLRARDVREALAQPADDAVGLVHAEGRLRQVGDALGVVELERVDVLLGLDEDEVAGRLAHRALDLLVALVADQHDRVALGGELLRLDVHLGHERAGGVDRLQPARLGVRVHRRRDAVRGEDHGLALGHLGLLLDEDRAALAQLLDDVLVVDDLLAHVDGRAVQLERALDRLDGTVDARAVAARGSEQQPIGGRGHRGQG